MGFSVQGEISGFLITRGDYFVTHEKTKRSLCWPQRTMFLLHVSLVYDTRFPCQASLMFKPSVTSLCELVEENI